MADAKLQGWFKRNVWNWQTKSTGDFTYDLKGTDARGAIFGYTDDFTREVVTERRAHQLSTVYSCINVRARTIASLPINIIREKKGQKESLTDHPSYYPLAQQANSYLSSANLFLTSMIHSDSWGNAIIGINRDGFEDVKSFDLVMPGDWNVKVSDGQAWYNVRGEMYRSSDILHFRWWALDGLCGISPIRQNAIEMGKAFQAERYAGKNMGQVIPGFLRYEGEMRPEQRAENQKSWENDRFAGRTPILSGKWDYKNTMLSPADIQYIDSMDLSDQHICGIFQVPPVFLQNYRRATWKNSEECDLIYAKHTITPIVRIIEQECNMKLFREREKRNTYVKFNMNGLLRGDIQARAAFYTAMRNVGGMNGNEIRSLEDMNAYEGGDIFTLQSANCPADQLRDFYKNKVASTATTESDKNGKQKNHNGVHHEMYN